MYYVALSTLVAVSSADLPIHCSKQQVMGVWQVTVGDQVSRGETCKEIQLPSLSPGYSFDVALHPSGQQESFESFPLHLSLGGSVLDPSEPTPSSWSTIHDEGMIFEGVINGRMSVFYGNFGYSNDQSQCDRVPRGWAIHRDPDGEYHVQCFSAVLSESTYSVNTDFRPIGYILPGLTYLPSAFKVPRWDLTGTEQTLLRQGKCGSCYVLGFAYAFERILMNEIGGSTVRLDRESLLACSYSNQGCGGGFYSTLTLDTMVTGIPSSGCLDGGALSKDTGKSQQCDDTCYTDRESLFYPSGFVELISEEAIKKFLLRYGPVPTSVRTGSRKLTNPPAVNLNTGLIDDVNHGVVIIGWTGNVWEIYNPWNGFGTVEIRRDGLVEVNAVGILPDIGRGKLAIRGSQKSIRSHENISN
jgi:hypothetical protein